MTDRVQDRGHISFSQLNMFQRCGKQYEHRYVLGIKEPPALKPSAGKAGHAGIEAHMRSKIETGIDPPRELMLDAFDTSWTRETLDVQLEQGENLGKTKDSTYYLLQHYHAAEAPKILPRAVELEFMLPITVMDEILPPIKGFIDMLKVPNDGSPATLDIDDQKFKFPGKSGIAYHKKQEEVDWTDQLTIYDMALQAAGITVDRLGFQSIIGPVFRDGDPIPAKEPSIKPLYRDERLMVPAVRAAVIERTKRKILAIVQAIRAGTFIPTNDPRTCGWCGYRKICPDSLAKDDFLAQMIREETP